MTRFPLTRNWLRTRARIEPALLTARSFEDAVSTRCRELALDGADEGDAAYAIRIERDPAEAAKVRTLVSVPESWLFRGRASFELLRARLMTLRVQGRTDIRMLSAGCAQGAEPISMAVTALATGFVPEACTVDAVDIEPVLSGALAHGRFSGMAARESIPLWAEQWFSRRDGDTIVHAEAREVVRPERADLFTWIPKVEYDILFCRNVFIYLAREGRIELLTKFAKWLAPDGLLILGHADAGFEVSDAFHSTGPSDAFAYAPGPPLERAAPAVRDAPPVARTAARPLDRTIARASPPAALPAASVVTLRECRELAAHGRVPEAERALVALLARQPDLVEGHCLHGELLLRRDAKLPAEEALRRALYLDPQCEDALMRLAHIADRGGRRDLAARYRARAMEAHLRSEGNG
ncbi:MAG: CheR family methyltransferase [Phycisphaerae bacterium]|nr:CheR family methyltransferase [Phycisphaerae bacterium]